jgi:hypothetical protein
VVYLKIKYLPPDATGKITLSDLEIRDNDSNVIKPVGMSPGGTQYFVFGDANLDLKSQVQLTCSFAFILNKGEDITRYSIRVFNLPEIPLK